MENGSINNALADLRPMLLRFAMLQLRNQAWAEDVVSETIIAAIEGQKTFAGESQLKTWVVGILKHKIIDHFRRTSREVSKEARQEATGLDPLDDLYNDAGARVNAPLEWGDPEDSLSRVQFFDVLEACVEKLPANLGRIFMMREWLEYETEQICKELDITKTNCFVMLHRARMRLRECLETNWFAERSEGQGVA